MPHPLLRPRHAASPAPCRAARPGPESQRLNTPIYVPAPSPLAPPRVPRRRPAALVRRPCGSSPFARPLLAAGASPCLPSTSDKARSRSLPSGGHSRRPPACPRPSAARARSRRPAVLVPPSCRRRAAAVPPRPSTMPLICLHHLISHRLFPRFPPTPHPHGQPRKSSRGCARHTTHHSGSGSQSGHCAPCPVLRAQNSVLVLVLTMQYPGLDSDSQHRQA